MDDKVKKAFEIMRGGGIVIFPTDTAFGIGCRIDDEKAIRRLFEIRKRPIDKAVPVLASSTEMVENYAEPFESEVRTLMKKYWPGALTLVLSAKTNKVPALVRAGGKTVGVRIPDYNSALRMIRTVGVPILGPSANFAGGKTPFAFSDLDPNLIRKVDFVLRGRCRIKKPSTVLDVSQKPWRIIREGAIKLEL
ncbi:MAG: threonylcarbamoyl-AMP synthase [Candidatus Levybacteria bacterium]|nr:threonylcarbamoyl-AMP synthase [Candidatus Levybacteria bacterium]